MTFNVNQSENSLYLSVIIYIENVFYYKEKHNFQDHYMNYTSNYIQKYNFQDHYMNCISFSFSQDPFLVQSWGFHDNVLMCVDDN